MLISGAHLAHEAPDLVGATPAGPAIRGSRHLALPVRGQAVSIGGMWQPVAANPSVAHQEYLLHDQEPERDRSNLVIVTRRTLGKGAITAIHGPLFQQYGVGHYPMLRRFIADLIANLHIPWLVEADGPAWLELILRRKHGCLLINLINRGAGEMLSPSRVIVEQLPAIHDITLRIRLSDPPRSVTVEPGGNRPDWHYADGLLQIHIPRVDIHDIVRVEAGNR